MFFGTVPGRHVQLGASEMPFLAAVPREEWDDAFEDYHRDLAWKNKSANLIQSYVDSLPIIMLTILYNYMIYYDIICIKRILVVVWI